MNINIGGECDHCWHDTGRLLTSDPPMAVERCCWCGEERHLRRAVHVPPGQHGPHAPFAGPAGGIAFPEASGTPPGD